MARRARCRVGDGGSVSVQSPGYGRVFGPGSEADLDEIVVPAAGQRPAQTLADALGKRLELFPEVIDAPGPRPLVVDEDAYGNEPGPPPSRAGE